MIKKFCGYCGNPLKSGKKASIKSNRSIGNFSIAHELKLNVGGKEVYFVTTTGKTFGEFYLIQIDRGSLSLSDGGYYSYMQIDLPGDSKQSLTPENYERYLSANNKTPSIQEYQKLNNLLSYHRPGSILKEDSDEGMMARVLSIFLFSGELERKLLEIKSKSNRFENGRDIKPNPSGSGASISRSTRTRTTGKERVPELLKMPVGKALEAMLSPAVMRTVLGRGYYVLAQVENKKIDATIEIQDYLKAKGLDPSSYDIVENENNFSSIDLVVVLNSKIRLKGVNWSGTGRKKVAEVETVDNPPDLRNFTLGENNVKASLAFVGIEDA